MSSVHFVLNMDTFARAVWREERPGFKPRLVSNVLVVDLVILGQIFLRILWFSPVNTPPVLHTRVSPIYHWCYVLCIVSVILLLVLNGRR